MLGAKFAYCLRKSASIYLMDAHKKADTKMRGIHFRLDGRRISLICQPGGLRAADRCRATGGGGTLAASRLQLAMLSALKESSDARFRVHAGQPGVNLDQFHEYSPHLSTINLL